MSKLELKEEFIGKSVNAGRILVLGNQASGKTAFATKIASISDPTALYSEDFGGTIQTEYLKASYNEDQFFALLLPIGGQEKWAKLRSAFGATAEGMVAIMDSTTKIFWPSSIRQAIDISSRIPYDDFPIMVVISKQDQNQLFQARAKEMSQVIADYFQTVRDTGLTFHVRGYTIREKTINVPEGPIPFSIAEQIIVNALESEYFEDVTPGFAESGKRKFKEFSLVNCRMFARAIASAFVLLNLEYLMNQEVILSLLNDMRPTMLELETNWDKLLKKYPNAGSEPFIPKDLTATKIEEIITKHLLADEIDIQDTKNTMSALTKETGWKLIDIVHSTVFTTDGLKLLNDKLYELLLEVQNSTPYEKMHLLNPLEEMF